MPKFICFKVAPNFDKEVVGEYEGDVEGEENRKNKPPEGILLSCFAFRRNVPGCCHRTINWYLD